ncbi:hypothetical protein SLS58_006456 [Diplodia intermedia]|uniref:Uncharacterized protein n=1 Tax=Diplodia intermedia TaxID=856260 RepID=A0ABR3TNN8_9PEZI
MPSATDPSNKPSRGMDKAAKQAVISMDPALTSPDASHLTLPTWLKIHSDCHGLTASCGHVRYGFGDNGPSARFTGCAEAQHLAGTQAGQHADHQLASQCFSDSRGPKHILGHVWLEAQHYHVRFSYGVDDSRMYDRYSRCMSAAIFLLESLG